MVLGVIMLLGTGVAWAFTGIAMSYTARRQVSLPVLFGTQVCISLILTFAFLPDYRALTGGVTAHVWWLAGILVVAGALNATGILTMQRAMHGGHHGITWAIGQSALVVPFLAGMLLFNDVLTPLRLVGIVAILASLAAFGYAREADTVTSGPRPPASWFLLAVSALLILGASQTLTTLPSHLPSLADPARLRVPLLYLGNALVYLGMWGRQPGKPDRAMVLFAVTGSLIGIVSSLLLFHGLDRLADARAASLGYPIAVGTCILAFALYSMLGLREPCRRWHLVGLLLGGCGVVCVALR